MFLEEAEDGERAPAKAREPRHPATDAPSKEKKPEPAVPIEHSVRRGCFVRLEEGRMYKQLERHLKAATA